MDEQTTERTIDQATAQRIIGARIREFREAAGLSQAELARRVYVSRQTVGNWEAGRTLADVQSLVLLSQVFGTTVDALIGEKGARAVRSTANERHELLRLLALCATLLVVCIALVFVRHLLSPLRQTNPAIEPLRDLMLLVMIVCEAILALRAVPASARSCASTTSRVRSPRRRFSRGATRRRRSQTTSCFAGSSPTGRSGWSQSWPLRC